jgi:hypothetical protein
MTDDQLKTYARLGLTARLAELDREQSALRALLASLDTELGSSDTEEVPPLERQPRLMSDDGRKRIGDAARRRWAAVRAAALVQTDGEASTPDVDGAHLLPRRGRLERQAVVAAPVLPPMPRLIKARAS